MLLRRTYLILMAGSVWLATAGHAHAKDVDIFERRVDLGIWTIVVFLGLFFVLKKYAFGPMLEGLAKREGNIKQAIDDARKTREEAQAAREQWQKELAGANEKIRLMMEDARKDADQIRVDMVAQGKKELAEEKDRAHRELQTAKDQALNEITSRAAELATLVSMKLIRKELSPSDHRGLVDEALAELKTASSHRSSTG